MRLCHAAVASFIGVLNDFGTVNVATNVRTLPVLAPFVQTYMRKYLVKDKEVFSIATEIALKYIWSVKGPD